MQTSSNNRFRTVLVYLGFVLAVGAAFFAGLVYGKPVSSAAATLGNANGSSMASIIGVGTNPPDDVTVPADFKQFWELWRRLRDQYYQQPVDEQKMYYGAMQGLASSLGDPYTVYFEPKTAADFQSSLQGKFEGIGAEIGIKDDQLQIIAPLPDNPAEKAGLLAGDFILKIGDQDTNGMSVEKAVSLIRGPKGTNITLNIGRYKVEKDAKGKEVKTPITKDYTIMRDVIVVKSVKTKYIEDGKIAVIEITSFNQDTGTLFSKAVDEILAKDVKGLILDLRNDPGGYLDRAISVAGEWVGDQAVVKERRQGKIVDDYHGTAGGRLKDMPTIVLVNQGSASASEIVAGCLQDYGLAKLVGTKTFGKGSVQDYSEFPDKSSVKITIAEWMTPKERSINKIGIEPDVKVELTSDDINANRDPQLDKAVEILTGKPAVASVPAKTTAKPAPTKSK